VDATTERIRQFERLAVEVYQPLQRYLLRRAPVAEAEDLLSETLLVIWRRLEAVPAAAPLPWCYGVARRTLANYRRSTARRRRLVERMSSQPERFVDDTDTSDIEDPEMFAAFHRLPDEDRELLRLWAWEVLEPREIAVVLETTPNAVSLHLKRAKQKLAEELLRQKSVGAGHMTDKHAQEM
jgi:RNA polymerase sigma-70 factor (ECF subfamily)